MNLTGAVSQTFTATPNLGQLPTALVLNGKRWQPSRNVTLDHQPLFYYLLAVEQ
jgi:hypothetical protein